MSVTPQTPVNKSVSFRAASRKRAAFTSSKNRGSGSKTGRCFTVAHFQSVAPISEHKLLEYSSHPLWVSNILFLPDDVSSGRTNEASVVRQPAISSRSTNHPVAVRDKEVNITLGHLGTTMLALRQLPND